MASDTTSSFRFVRLNATMYPANELEQSLYAKFDIEPEYVEEEDPQELIRQLANCDAVAVVSTGLPAAVVSSLDRCRLISRLGNGTDKIAVEKATECGIVVSNAPFFCAEEMTDHIMAMLLSLARQLPRMEQFMRAGRFRQARAESTQLQRLSTCALGIVGFGATGEMVARRASVLWPPGASHAQKLTGTPAVRLGSRNGGPGNATGRVRLRLLAGAPERGYLPHVRRDAAAQDEAGLLPNQHVSRCFGR